MQRFQVLVMTFFGVLVFSYCSKKKEEVPGLKKIEISSKLLSAETQKEVICPSFSLCEPFVAQEKECRIKKENEKACKDFVESYKAVSAKKGCKRNFDSSEVPTLWLCEHKVDEGISERAARTLSQLNFDFAKKFYSSKLFKATLDGALAEEHMSTK